MTVRELFRDFLLLLYKFIVADTYSLEVSTFHNKIGVAKIIRVTFFYKNLVLIVISRASRIISSPELYMCLQITAQNSLTSES
jgi:hypothetical protein